MALKKVQQTAIEEVVETENDREKELLTAQYLAEKRLNKMLAKREDLEDEINSTKLTLELITQELEKVAEGE